MRAIATVVVVILLLVLSLGMLLPRLLRTREDVGRIYCLQNLQEMYKALFLYHQQHEAFPAAVASTRGLPPVERVSWLAALLPYLGDEALYKQVNFRAGWEAPANHQALHAVVRKFHCPSVVLPREAEARNLTHYVGMAGLGPDAARLPREDPRAGCFGYYREITLAYIREGDGASATILVLETARENGPWLAGGPPTARGLDPARKPYVGWEGQFGGTHQAGTQGLYADGSARLHTSAMNPRVLEALVTVGGIDGEQGGLR